nr:MAG TPA: hypothetical protein [Caudoviricetes sp.]
MSISKKARPKSTIRHRWFRSVFLFVPTQRKLWRLCQIAIDRLHVRSYRMTSRQC